MLFIIIGLMFAIASGWCFRIAKRLPVHVGENASNIYARLLARMWWRVLVLTVIFGVILAAGGQDPEESARRLATAIEVSPLLFLLVLIPAWRAAKRRLAGGVTPTDDRRAELPATPQTAAVATKSTWWKRLFTVLEVAVALLAIAFDMMFYSPLQLAAWAAIMVVAVPVGIVHLVRIGVTYIVEGDFKLGY